MLGQAMALRGRAIVSDVEFSKASPFWTANEAKLRHHGVLMAEGIDVFDVAKGMHIDVQLHRVGLVVFGGFHPRPRASAAVQCLSRQIPGASVMCLYPSRDEPPQYQDDDKVHIEAWTADEDSGFAFKDKTVGGGQCPCWKAKSVKERGATRDPSLVKVSIFTSNPSQVTYKDAKLSPSMYVESFLSSNRDVLFCCAGDASLPCSCLYPAFDPSLEPERFHKEYGPILSYQWLLAQRGVHDAPKDSFAFDLHLYLHESCQLQYIAQTWAESWPNRKRRRTS